MAAVAVHGSQSHFSGHFQVPVEPPDLSTGTMADSQSKYQPRHVITSVNYFKDNEDGSAPAPAYVGKPESYERPTTPQSVTINDIRGSEEKYTLDSTGFQIVHHKSKEKDFLDEEKIKDEYYKETEELLKKM